MRSFSKFPGARAGWGLRDLRDSGFRAFGAFRGSEVWGFRGFSGLGGVFGGDSRTPGLRVVGWFRDSGGLIRVEG